MSGDGTLVYLPPSLLHPAGRPVLRLAPWNVWGPTDPHGCGWEPTLTLPDAGACPVVWIEEWGRRGPLTAWSGAQLEDVYS